MGCGVWGVGCGVWGVGCGVWDVEEELGCLPVLYRKICLLSGVVFGVWGLGFGAQGFKSQAPLVSPTTQKRPALDFPQVTSPSITGHEPFDNRCLPVQPREVRLDRHSRYVSVEACFLTLD